MKLTLEQTNIEIAVRAYLQATYGLSLRNKETIMEFKAGRGANGISVNVTIEDVTIPGEIAQVNAAQGLVTGYATEPKVSAADKIVAAVNSTPEGTMGALIADSSPVADLPSTTPVETPIVVEGQVPPQETGTPDPFVATEGTPAGEAEVPAVTTEDAVQDESPVVEAAPVKATTSGLFS